MMDTWTVKFITGLFEDKPLAGPTVTHLNRNKQISVINKNEKKVKQKHLQAQVPMCDVS